MSVFGGVSARSEDVPYDVSVHRRGICEWAVKLTVDDRSKKIACTKGEEREACVCKPRNET